MLDQVDIVTVRIYHCLKSIETFFAFFALTRKGKIGRSRMTSTTKQRTIQHIYPTVVSKNYSSSGMLNFEKQKSKPYVLMVTILLANSHTLYMYLQ